MSEQLTLFGAPPMRVRRDALPGRQRHARLGGRWISFRFERVRRAAIRLVVDGEGLSVRAPMNAPWREVEQFLLEKQDWIVARLDEWAAVPPRTSVFGVSGDRLPLHGTPVTLEVRAGPATVVVDGDRLVVRTPRPAARSTVLALLVRWLRHRTVEAFTPSAARYAGRLGRDAPAVQATHARRMWGVCDGRGTIRLSWRLAQLPRELAEYVVAHEVAHLVEFNHSPRFWAIVGSLYPDWQAARTRLELAGAALPLLKG